MLKNLARHMQGEAVATAYGDWPEQQSHPLYLSYNKKYTQNIQRMLDISVSILAMLIFTPFLPLIAGLIKLDSAGPVFYSQTRIGQDRRQSLNNVQESNRRKIVIPGRPFRVWKLRTMRTDAEKNGPQWASKNDSRITRLGAFLRKSRIDELPQFWNVLCGDMSVVGPRPERLCFILKLRHEVHQYSDRLLVRPGITGLAQIENGYDTDLESVRRKVNLDREYINNMSLKNDLLILLKTFSVVFTGSGAN
jgi:lipopolysaccharide/colanic/teichoic acid biosynthesis glycosyltransferase